MHWTCCACEKQVDERYFNTEERMCDDCMDEEYCDIVVKKGSTYYTKHMELMKLKTNTNNRRNVMDKFIKAMELLTVLILGQPKRKRGRPRKKGVFK